MEESWVLPPEACETPLKREPVMIQGVPLGSGEVAPVICGCQSGRRKPSPVSYSSALVNERWRPSSPVATSTLPLVKRVALCKCRPLARLPVVVQVPLTGSYSSALARLVV